MSTKDFLPHETAFLRAGFLYAWSSAAIFGALLYLTGSTFKSLLIAIFVFFSCIVGFGRRRLIQASFAIVVLAILVSYGFPAPDQWIN